MTPRDQTLRPVAVHLPIPAPIVEPAAAPPSPNCPRSRISQISTDYPDGSVAVLMGRPTANRITSREKIQPLFKLERIPDYLRDTVDWIIGRKRKDDKVAKAKRGVASASLVQRPFRKSQSSELCVCDSIDDQMIEKFSKLPAGIDRREWLAAHTLSLFDHVNSLCGSLSEICSPATCQSMSFPGTSKAQFVDERGKRHSYPAQQYIHAVLSFCETESRNENIFPTKYGNQFSPEFEAHIRRVIRLLWHCLGHLYLKHWDHLGSLELRPQCALVLAHLSCLSKLFNLLDAKDQALVEETLIIVRPPLFTVQAPSEEKEEVPQQPRYSRVPSSKSGSWGGHPTPAVLSCKPYAQTC